MIQFITFNLVSSVAFFLLYRTLLSGLTFFQVNRLVLIAGICMIALGTVKPDFFSTSSTFNQVIPIELEEVAVSVAATNFGATVAVLWRYVIGIYVLGLFMGFIRVILGLIQVAKVIHESKIDEQYGYHVFRSKKINAPFSFASWIVIPSSLDGVTLQHVIQHEMVHVRQCHSLERVLTEVLCVVFWFNPFIWKLRSELVKIHEFIADDAILHSHNQKEYQASILQLASGSSSILGTASNTFSNPAITKTRFDMMNRQRTSKGSMLRYLLMIPLFAGLVVFSGAEIGGAQAQAKQELKKEVDVMPEFPGGQQALFQYMIDNIKYPKDAEKEGVEGKVLVGFNVDKTGAITEVRIKRGVHPSLDKQAVSVVAAMPKWKPGMDNGKAVTVEMVLPIAYKLVDGQKDDKQPRKG